MRRCGPNADIKVGGDVASGLRESLYPGPLAPISTVLVLIEFAFSHALRSNLLGYFGLAEFRKILTFNVLGGRVFGR